MNAEERDADEWDPLLETFAAELTGAAYGLALRRGVRGSWVDLELDLWHALTDTVRRWARPSPRAGRPGEFEVWREGLLGGLTDAAYLTTLRYGVRGSCREVEWGLYRAFRSLIGGRWPIAECPGCQ
jgi:hypothetical protein